MSMWKKPQPKPKLDLSKYQSIVPFLFSDPAQYEDFLLQFAYKDPDTVFKILTNEKSHAKIFHIDSTLQEDITRIYNEGVTGAGSFFNDSEASINVMDAIVDNISRITTWMKSPRSAMKDRLKVKDFEDDKFHRCSIEYIASSNIGSAWKQEGGRVVEYVTPQLKLVLGRNMHSYTGFVPVTAYPDAHTPLAQPTGRSFTLREAVAKDIIVSRDPYIQTAVKYKSALPELHIDAGRDRQHRPELKIMYTTQYNSMRCAYSIYYYGPEQTQNAKTAPEYKIARLTGANKIHLTYTQLTQQCPELAQELNNIREAFLYNQKAWHCLTPQDMRIAEKLDQASQTFDQLADKIAALDEKEAMALMVKTPSAKNLDSIRITRDNLLQEAHVLYDSFHEAYPDRPVYEAPVLSYTSHVLAKRIATLDYEQQLRTAAQNYAVSFLNKTYQLDSQNLDNAKAQEQAYRDAKQAYITTLYDNRPDIISLDDAAARTKEALEAPQITELITSVAQSDMIISQEICERISKSFSQIFTSKQHEQKQLDEF